MKTLRLPQHFRQAIPSGPQFFAVTETLQKLNLPTVCEEAKCPNRTHCYAQGSLTFQILGRKCTRRCGFCAEITAVPDAIDGSEPERLAEAVAKLGLSHVVVTAPARDDLSDGGAAAFAQSIRAIRARNAAVSIEILISDLQGNLAALEHVLQSAPDIFNHNIETVERLTPRVRAKATYRRSLSMLASAKKMAPQVVTKSGLMVGLGEEEAEILSTLQDLRQAQVEYLTIGQYLPPSSEHLPLARYATLEDFARWKQAALNLGFAKVFSGPLVRSSFHAGEMLSSQEALA